MELSESFRLLAWTSISSARTAMAGAMDWTERKPEDPVDTHKMLLKVPS